MIFSRRSRTSLFRKYSTVLLTIVGATILTGGIAELSFNYRDSRAATLALQRAEVDAAGRRIDDYLIKIRELMADVAALPWQSNQIAPTERRAEYLRLLKLVPAISQLTEVDANDREVLVISRTVPDAVAGTSVSAQRPLLEVARATGVAFGAVHFAEGSEPYVTLAVRDFQSSAVTMAELNLKFVADLVGRIRVGAQGKVYVVDAAGRLVAHPNLSLLLRNPDISSTPIVQEVASRAKQGEIGGSDGLVTKGIEGDEVVASTKPIATSGWTAIVEQPRSEVFAPVYRSLARTSVVLMLGLVMALVASYGLARTFSGPIVRLRQGAERIAHKDLSARIDVRTGDEIEALAAEFNAMAAQLQEYTAGLERKVLERTGQLEAAMRARALFLAAASHDLRQPLYAIAILADTLSMEALGPTAAEILARQREAIAVLRSLFDNLLDLSRLDAGDVRVAKRVVAVRELLGPSALDTEIICRSRGLAFEATLTDVWVETDPDLVRRVVANLLSNSVRYTEEGIVRLATEHDGAEVVVSVSDTGIGIDPKDQARIFDEFVQLSSPVHDRDRGVGLGLSIVNRICELLVLPLHLESTLGAGTTFKFRLPLASPPQRRGAEDLA